MVMILGIPAHRTGGLAVLDGLPRACGAYGPEWTMIAEIRRPAAPSVMTYVAST